MSHFIRLLATSRRPRWPRAADGSPPAAFLQSPPPDAIVATFINHSSFLVQMGGFNLLTDPVYSDRIGPFNLGGPRRVRPPGIPFEQLPRIDVVLLSHNHYDHTDLATLKRLQRTCDPLLVASKGNERYLRRRGFNKVVEMDWWEKHTGRDGLEILHTPAQHFSSRSLFDRDCTLWGGYVVSVAGQRLYFAGDSGYAGHFELIGRRVAPVDFALIPIGGYEPRWFMEMAHMDPEEAVRVHLEVKPRLSVAMHFGTFQLAHEAVDAPIRLLREALEKAHVPETDFVVPEFGESILLKAKG